MINYLNLFAKALRLATSFMKISKQYYSLVLAFILPTLLLQNTGCYKEYSIEGIDTTRMIRDTASPGLVGIVKTFPDCSFCNAESAISTGQWNFKTGNSFLCGGVTNSGFFSGYSRENFTLFGPSACSVDTGLVLSVYLSVPLDRDCHNLITYQTAFYYYDNHAPKDIFISLPPEPFEVVVQSYIYATGIVTGTFSGTVFKANGDTTFITDGKFKVQLK